MAKKIKSIKKLPLKLIALVCLLLAFAVIFYFSTFAGTQKPIKIGAYTYWYGMLEPDYEKPLERKFDAFLWYASINQSFDTNFGANLKKDNRLLQLAWEPAFSGNGFNASDYTLKKISQGAHDDNIRRWARELKSYGGEVYFRPMSEMNGNWASWSGTTNTNKPEDYKPAWIKIRKIFKEEGATNVKFVWAVNYKSIPDTAENAIEKYYPGNAYVDIIGINGYNSGNPELSFDQIFSKPYRRVLRLSKNKKPIIIAETASYNYPGKSKWITDMGTVIRRKYPKITQVYWFNTNKEQQWQINQPPEAMGAFRSMMDTLRSNVRINSQSDK